MDSSLDLHVPGQQLIDPVDRMVGDDGEHMTQVGLGIDTTQACRA